MGQESAVSPFACKAIKLSSSISPKPLSPRFEYALVPRGRVFGINKAMSSVSNGSCLR